MYVFITSNVRAPNLLLNGKNWELKIYECEFELHAIAMAQVLLHMIRIRVAFDDDLEIHLWKGLVISSDSSHNYGSNCSCM